FPTRRSSDLNSSWSRAESRRSVSSGRAAPCGLSSSLSATIASPRGASHEAARTVLTRLRLRHVAVGHLAPVDAEVVAAGRTVADPCLVEDRGAVLPVVRERQHRADPALLAAHQG